MNYVLMLMLSLVAAGCTLNYSPPSSSAPVSSRAIDASHSDLLGSAQQVLASEGFRITSVDELTGVISTAPQIVKLTPHVADCGSTFGLGFLKDHRTTSTVGYVVLVTENMVTVNTTLNATYMPTFNAVNLTCVSRGVLEDSLLTRIATIASR